MENLGVTELVVSLVLVIYTVIGLWYSSKMEADKTLKGVYKIRTNHNWFEICLLLGFLWPATMLVNIIIRSKNAH